MDRLGRGAFQATQGWEQSRGGGATSQGRVSAVGKGKSRSGPAASSRAPQKDWGARVVVSMEARVEGSDSTRSVDWGLGKGPRERSQCLPAKVQGQHTQLLGDDCVVLSMSNH